MEKEKTSKELRQEYDEFINNIPLYLEKMKTILKKEKLTFDFDEIDYVKEVYVKNHKHPDNVRCNYWELTQIFYAYMGEAFIHHQGGKWVFSKWKQDRAYGTPTIEEWGGEDYPWGRISPYVWRLILEKEGVSGLNPARRVFGNEKW